MDTATGNLEKVLCEKHPTKELQFIHIGSQREGQEEKADLYYCEICQSEDTCFSSTEMLSINQIIEYGEKSILPKWPPVNDYKLIKELIQKTKQRTTDQPIENLVLDYFTNLRAEIMKEIDHYQKKVINLVSDLSPDNDYILNNYKSISKIDQLRALVEENQKNQMNKTEELSSFIQKLQSEKDQNTKLLQNLLNRYTNLQNTISINHLNAFKDQLLKYIQKLDLFCVVDENKVTNQDQSNLHLSADNKYSSLIMKLIANKSNFCSKDFLSEIQKYIQLLDPVISSLKEDRTTERDPLRFELLEINDFELITKQVDHCIKQKENQSYSSELLTSEQIKYFEQLWRREVQKDLKKQLGDYYVKTFPYVLDFFLKNNIDLERHLSELRFSEVHKACSIQLKSNTIAEKLDDSLFRFGLTAPQLSLTKPTRFAFKIIKMQTWIGLGVCFTQKIVDLQYEFKYDTIGHGYYLISNNGYSWSHSEQPQHYVCNSFQFVTGDVIQVEFNPLQGKVKFQKQSDNSSYHLDIRINDNDEMSACVSLGGPKDEIEILNDPSINSIQFA